VTGTQRSLSARSVVLSTLLGTTPPRLPGRLLVALAGEFGIAEGTTRVALSRMVDRDELGNVDGTYHLAGPLLERHDRQERSRRPGGASDGWDGDWELRVVRGGARRAAERAELRRALVLLGLAELREGTWLRPANLDPDRLPARRALVDTATDAFAARPGEPVALAARLWPLDSWAAEAGRLQRQMAAVTDRMDQDDRAALVPGFELSAAVLRHLLADPVLPAPLAPPAWPADGLRTSYDAYDDAYRRLLRRFFRQVRDSPG
jgi:phenylacetic acid degradation operon negative regulatory protein